MKKLLIGVTFLMAFNTVAYAETCQQYCDRQFQNCIDRDGSGCLIQSVDCRASCRSKS